MKVIELKDKCVDVTDVSEAIVYEREYPYLIPQLKAADDGGFVYLFRCIYSPELGTVLRHIIGESHLRDNLLVIHNNYR
jgi:hypothetical protein